MCTILILPSDSDRKTDARRRKFLSGEEIKGRPRFFIGAAENPFATLLNSGQFRLAKKSPPESVYPDAMYLQRGSFKSGWRWYEIAVFMKKSIIWEVSPP
jgi:hypothetical protein